MNKDVVNDCLLCKDEDVVLYVTAHAKLSHLSANFTTSYEP